MNDTFNLLSIKTSLSIPDEFEQYCSDQRVLVLEKLYEEENLDEEQFKLLIDATFITNANPLGMKFSNAWTTGHAS